jgi:aminopeptidase-like protein
MNGRRPLSTGASFLPIDRTAVGEEMHAFIADLFPICRSITGDGVRETIRCIGRRVPLEVSEVPSGTPVLDWTVPREWNIRDAYVADPNGKRVIDFKASNLHVVSYSVPFRGRLDLGSLREHLHTLPEHPDWIPYRTSYYRESWGFCLSQRQLEAVPDGEYEVCIDASLREGHLTYAECYLPGAIQEEILFSCHICHPSLADDNLSGVAVCTFLAQRLMQLERRYSYRFLFVPGTIGSLAWLARNDALLDRIRHGLVLACVGDAAPLTYKRSRRGGAEVDRAMEHVLRHAAHNHQIIDFDPYGYDERQYCSPGFDLPVGSLSRSRHGAFPEYHTSADNLAFVHPAALEESLAVTQGVIEVLEGNGTYRNLFPKGEPQLGRRGLYPSLGGRDSEAEQMALLWVLNQSDGQHSLLEVADRAGMAFGDIRMAADRLLEHGLLEPVKTPDSAVNGQ